MSIVRKAIVAIALLLPMASATAASRDEAVAAVRERFVKSARLDEAYFARPEETRRGTPSGYDEDRELMKEPEDLLLEAIDQVIRGGTTEERAGGLGIYNLMIYDHKTKPNPEYLPILLELLANDDGSSYGLTGGLLSVLHWYPTRETVLAFVRTAERSTDFETRYGALGRAAGLMGMNLGIYVNATPEQNEKRMADFISWVRRNEDRIQFSKSGRFRLAGGEAAEDGAGLRAADRERIRKDPAGVLRLFNQVVGDEDDSTADLGGEAAAGLFGPEAAALMAKRAALAREGKDSDPDLEAKLGALQGTYPVEDAALLAAVYAVSYEKDAGTLKTARGMLMRATREEVRRVAGSEPRAVRKKAEALAGERGKTPED